MSSNQKETIAVHVKYIEDELEIRVESLKIELDNYLEKFKSDLKVLKQNLIEYIVTFLFLKHILILK